MLAKLIDCFVYRRVILDHALYTFYGCQMSIVALHVIAATTIITNHIIIRCLIIIWISGIKLASLHLTTK